MRCTHCQHTNRHGVNYCEHCGHAIASICPQCRDVGPQDRNFCGRCGFSMSGAIDAVTSASPNDPTRMSRMAGAHTAADNHPLQSAPEVRHQASMTSELSRPPSLTTDDGDRRNLTVMFCDLVDSTSLAASVDPEDLTRIVHAFTESTSNICRKYGGHVTRILGDAVLCYFGYPQAFEDATRRAMLAALDIVNATPLLSPHESISLHCRVGIAYGEVVTNKTIETDFGSETIAIGTTPNLAARLQELASPDSVVVTTTVKKLTQDDFVFVDAGLHPLKGFSQHQQLWEVASTAHRMPEQATIGLDLTPSPLIGRDQEMQEIVARWKRSSDSYGQLVHVSGQPGIGKTRLTEACIEHATGTGGIAVHLTCSSLEQHSALSPVSSWLSQLAGIQPADDETLRRDKVNAVVNQQKLDCHLLKALFDLLISPTHGDSGNSADEAPRERKRQLFTTLKNWLTGLSARQPVLMIIEDLQWADPTTLDWLMETASTIERQPVMLLVSSRPEFVPSWRADRNRISLNLYSLSRASTIDIIKKVAGGKRFPGEVVELILQRTDGVPLYVEAFTQAVLEAGTLQEHADHFAMTGPLPSVGVPTTLTDSLMARLDRYPHSRNIAQIASVVGREFVVAVLEHIASDKTLVDAGLRTLHETDLAKPCADTQVDTWAFKHALVRDVAYNSLLHSKRRQIHQLVAETLEQLQIDVSDTRPEILAYHWSEAAQPIHSIPLWYEAAIQSQSLWANREASAQYRQALTELDTLAPDQLPNQSHLELELQLGLGDSCRAAFGSSNKQTLNAYKRAITLCTPETQNTQALRAHYGAFIGHFTAADLPGASRYADALQGIADETRTQAAKTAAAQALGMYCFATGDLQLAQRHFSDALSCKLADNTGSLDLQYPALTQSYLSWTLHILGEHDKALTICNASLADAQKKSPYDHALTLSNSCYLHQFRDDPPAIKTSALALQQVARDKALPAWQDVAQFFLSYVACYGADSTEPVETITNALDLWDEDEIEIPYFQALVAQIMLQRGLTTDGAALLNTAYELMRKTGETWYLLQLKQIAATYRVRLNGSSQQLTEPGTEQFQQ